MDVQYIEDNKRFKMRASALIIEDGKLLLTKNNHDPMYYTIGGKVEFGETAEEAVIREAYEETGVKYEVDRLVYIQELFYEADFSSKFNHCHEMMFHFLMKPTGIKEFNVESRTHDDLLEEQVWISIEDLPGEYVYPRFIGENLFPLPETVKHIVSYDDY